MEINGIEMNSYKGVSETKLEAITDLINGALRGDRAKKGVLEAHLTTGDDSIHALAAAMEINFLPLLEKEQRNWRELATERSVTSFETPKLYTIDTATAGGTRTDKSNGGENPADVAPVVPESSPYPHLIFSGELITPGAGIRKRGGVFSLSWEKFLSDITGLVSQIPALLTEWAINAEQFEIDGAIKETTKDSSIVAQGGTTFDGKTVAKNAPLSREALVAGLRQLSQRKYLGRLLNHTGSYTLVVPVGASYEAEWIVNGLQAEKVTTDGVEFAIDAAYRRPLQKITNIVETEVLTGTEWLLIPTPGSTKYPVFEMLKLAGHETPDLRVKADQGQRIGGGLPGPFEGSFDTDDAQFRVRYPLRGVAWVKDYVLFSNGTGK